jgi:hypothetical protein
LICQYALNVTVETWLGSVAIKIGKNGIATIAGLLLSDHLLVYLEGIKRQEEQEEAIES